MISGIVKSSLIDYPGKIACTIFLSGCNFRCPYCHNGDLVNQSASIMSLIQLKQFLIDRVGLLEGVVISGGEPTLSPYIFEIAGMIKSMNLSVKLDTNGSRPEVLKRLITEKLVDYVAMDIKGVFSKYISATNVNQKLDNIKCSIQMIMNSTIDYEFRTTVVKEFHTINDFEYIGELINKAKRYCIQPYRYSNKQLVSTRYHVHDKDELIQIKNILNRYVDEVIIK